MFMECPNKECGIRNTYKAATKKGRCRFESIIMFNISGSATETAAQRCDRHRKS